MKTPLVSVLIPVYNTEKYIQEAVLSVVNQTFRDFELIIIDNHSTDGTIDRIKPFLADPRVTLYTNENNIGVVANLNRCLSHARCEYIKMLCADDLIHSELLETFVSILQQYSDVSLVTSSFQFIGDYERTVTSPHAPGIVTGKEAAKSALLIGNWLGSPTAVMFRKSNLQLGNFKEDLRWIPDLDMWLRHLTAGNLYVVPRVLSFYRIHKKQESKKLFHDLVHVKEEYEYTKFVVSAEPVFGKFTQAEKRLILKSKAVQAFFSLPAAIKRKRLSLVKDLLRIAFAERVLISGSARLPLYMTRRLIEKRKNA
jgi:glycosyltransferase involved in cell wall biosynthesis